MNYQYYTYVVGYTTYIGGGLYELYMSTANSKKATQPCYDIVQHQLYSCSSVISVVIFFFEIFSYFFQSVNAGKTYISF